MLSLINNRLEIFLKSNFLTQIKNSIFYFGASVIQLIISLYTSPIFAKNLSTTDFAIIGYYLTIQSFLSIFFTFSFQSYYINVFFKNSETDRKKILSTIIIFSTVFNLILSTIIFFALKLYFSETSVIIPSYPYQFLLIGIMYLNVYATLFEVNFRVNKKAINYFIFKTLLIFSNIVLALLFVVHYKMGAEGRMIATFLSQFLYAIIAIIFLSKILTFKFSKIELKKAIRFSLPLVISSIFYFPIISLDNIYLEKLNNLNSLGLYNIGLNVANYLFVMFFAIYQAIEPDIAKHTIQKNKAALIKTIGLFSIILCLCTLLFILFSKTILNYLTAGIYTSAYNYANLLAFSFFLVIIFSFLNCILMHLQKTRLLFIINVIGGLSSFAVYHYLISIYTFEGAAYGRIILFALMALLCVFFISQRNKKWLRILRIS